jgi:hypothetical protein
MLRTVLATILLLASTVAAGAQSTLTGKWQGDTDGGASLALDLTVKGEVVTGTVTRNGQGAPLSEGKVTQNTFTFKATMNERAETFSGEWKGDEMRIWLERQGPSKAIVLTRVKRAASERSETSRGSGAGHRGPASDGVRASGGRSPSDLDRQ